MGHLRSFGGAPMERYDPRRDGGQALSSVPSKLHLGLYPYFEWSGWPSVVINLVRLVEIMVTPIGNKLRTHASCSFCCPETTSEALG